MQTAPPGSPEAVRKARGWPVAKEGPHPARFSVAGFHRLCELLPERRLELINGKGLERW